METIKSITRGMGSSKEYEILVLINHACDASDEIKRISHKCLLDLNAFKAESALEQLHILEYYDAHSDKAGVGLARKLVMDEAAKRFWDIHRLDGLIVCTDGDTVVDQTYMESLLKLQSANKISDAGFCFGFEHSFDGLEAVHTDAIARYELHLRYFRRCHFYIGHPHGYFTVGSAMGCTMEGYVKQGGMNQRKAGEDFYFLQKFGKSNRLYYHPEITVYPSGRESDRVPFGTGRAVMEYMSNGHVLTYDFRAIGEVRKLINRCQKLWAEDLDFIDLHQGIIEFLQLNDFFNVVPRLRSQSLSRKEFLMRIFGWFDAFKVMKCLHLLRDQYGFQDQEVLSQCHLLDQAMAYKSGEDIMSQLHIYRQLDREE